MLKLHDHTTNICNSAQKENVNLGWEKHIPNFTENGQKWKIEYTEHAQHFFKKKNWSEIISMHSGNLRGFCWACSVLLNFYYWAILLKKS
jgi:hypothetical protein